MFYGETKKGIISVTEGQVKKHFTQFLPVEKAFLFKTLRLVKRIKISKHVLDKDITVDENLIKKALQNGSYSIIEYNERTYPDKVSRRALIRIKQSVNVFLKNEGAKKACNLCCVIDIETGIVITAYYNECKDNHETVDFKRYDKTLKVIK